MTNIQQNQQYILFRVAGETYGVSVIDTHEVIRFKEPRRIPHAPKHILGVINLRGQIIPVVGLRERFSVESMTPNEETRVIVITFEGKLTGLVCDTVERVVTIPAENIEESAEYQKSKSVSSIRGVAHLDETDSVVFLLALETLQEEIALDSKAL